MSNESNRLIDEEIERIFNGKTVITTERFKEVFEEFQNDRTPSANRGRGAMSRPTPIHDDVKQKINLILGPELDKIKSNTITKEQAKTILLAWRNRSKEEWHSHMSNHIQSSIKDEMKKRNIHEVNAEQAHDIVRMICHQMSESHVGTPSVLDDSNKHEFLNEFKTKHGTSKIDADEVWEMIKVFDKKQHDKMGCCEKNSELNKESEKKWNELFNEQYKELFGDQNNTKINEQQLGELANRMKEKNRQDCIQHPGKRFCQH
ncbi:hypothetical protein I4U23_007116 [Adineta vaga]|nr:hypothetical protein I4U23_007116 [Adineta vaga]